MKLISISDAFKIYVSKFLTSQSNPFFLELEAFCPQSRHLCFALFDEAVITKYRVSVVQGETLSLINTAEPIKDRVFQAKDESLNRKLVCDIVDQG